MRRFLLATCFMLAAAGAQVQAQVMPDQLPGPPPGPGGPQEVQPAPPPMPAPRHPGRARQGGRFAQRFAAANVTHDGRLTRDQAQALPQVARHFDAIDTAHKGYVTRADIRAWRVARRAARPAE